KKIGLWYAHGKVSFSLKVAEKLTDLIFTSTVEGCRLNSNKIRIVGQGIDIEKFKVQSDSDSCHPRPRRARINSSGDPEISSKLKVTGDIFKIITIGRISPAKDYETLIRAAEILKKENLRFRIEIIGGVGAPEQEKYLSELKKMVADLGLGEEVIFAGGIPHEEIMNYLAAANLFANMSQTGSLDKAILEAMAAGLSVVTSNEAAVKMLSAFAEQMVFPQKDFRTLAERIKFFIKLSNSERIKYGESLRKIVETEHGLKGLIEKIIKNYA
ncbi:MAG: glycosyltransferase family 4 protein, partial [Parcubacteria group bacterium]